MGTRAALRSHSARCCNPDGLICPFLEMSHLMSVSSAWTRAGLIRMGWQQSVLESNVTSGRNPLFPMKIQKPEAGRLGSTVVL